MLVKRPKVSIVLFNKNQESIKVLIDSLESLDKPTKSQMEFNFVVYDKKLSKENEQLALSLRQFMPVRFMDYSEIHDETDLNYYARGYTKLVKSYNDTVTQKEIESYLKEGESK